jgi:chemotaxis protein MotB
MIHRFFRRRSDDNRSDSIWLTVYSDLITNLALVFLALYGLVTMGNDAIQQAANSMKDPVAADVLNRPADQTVLTLQHVARLLRQEFKDQSEIAVLEEPGVTRIQFGESVLFDSGHAELKSTAGPILEKTATFLALLPYTIVVEGHTDNRPIRGNSAYRDNWELSLARAMSVTDILSKRGGIPPKQIAAAAYGDNRPRASNLMPSSRRLNRRVEIALFTEFPFNL